MNEMPTLLSNAFNCSSFSVGALARSTVSVASASPYQQSNGPKVINGGILDDDRIELTVTSDGIEDGAWQHIAMVSGSDKDDVNRPDKFFINGQEVPRENILGQDKQGTMATWVKPADESPSPAMTFSGESDYVDIGNLLDEFEAIRPYVQTTLQMGDPMARRLVRVLIVDPDSDLSIESAVLHDSGEKWTDLTDQELYFECEIQPLLEAHNADRAATKDQDRSDQYGRDVMLEPIRISDLTMSVVLIASF